jgi:hypothetical protein
MDQTNLDASFAGPKNSHSMQEFEYLGDFMGDRRHGVGQFLNSKIKALANWDFDFIKGFAVMTNTDGVRVRGKIEN